MGRDTRAAGPVDGPRRCVISLVSALCGPYAAGVADGDPLLALVTDLARRMSVTPDPARRVEAMLEAVAHAGGASVALLLRSDPTHTHVEVEGASLPEAPRRGLVHELVLMRVSDPLLDPVSHGDLVPRSAERVFGREAWAASRQREGCLEYCGVDQVCTLPLVGGPDFAIVLLGRLGTDFSDDDLEQLAVVRPVVASLATLAGIRPLPWPGTVPRLTSREREVLELLAAGHTATRIGRELGTSPRTVEVHLRRIYDKLDVADRLTAVLRAYDLDLLPPRAAAVAPPAV